MLEVEILSAACLGGRFILGMPIAHSYEVLSKVFSAGLIGIDAYLVEVEVDIASGLATWNTVGLPESSVRESRDRVIGAIRNSGYDFHRRRITINLAPANVRKEGTAFDLPMAVGLLASSNLFPAANLSCLLMVGELSLHGEVKPVLGALSLAILAKRRGFSLILPERNLAEASVVEGLSLFTVRHLSQVVQHLVGEKPLLPGVAKTKGTEGGRAAHYPIDFSEVKGQPLAKRAIEVAAAGGHNLLMIGPPGSGKTMLAQRLPTILPPMDRGEALETTRIYSASGLPDCEDRLVNGASPLILERPFRAPHHLISDAGLAGGVTQGGFGQRPGEASLAHNGVLFLDELPEFRRNVLEILRQPLESGKVMLARAQSTVTYPARFMLVAAMNPCRCGYLGSGLKDCSCTSLQIQQYRSRLSGPLIDRIDIQVEVPALRYHDLAEVNEGEPSVSIQSRVLTARRLQQERYRSLKIYTNAQLRGRSVRRYCPLDEVGARLLERAVEKIGLSARAYDRILKVARTLADLAGSDSIGPNHLAEAIHYRCLDRDAFR